MSELISANLVAQNDSVGRDDTLRLYFSAAVNNTATAAMIRLTTGTGPTPTNIPFTVS